MLMNKLAGRCEVDRGPVCPDPASGQAAPAEPRESHRPAIPIRGRGASQERWGHVADAVAAGSIRDLDWTHVWEVCREQLGGPLADHLLFVRRRL